jgi:hypothetical protein
MNSSCECEGVLALPVVAKFRRYTQKASVAGLALKNIMNRNITIGWLNISLIFLIASHFALPLVAYLAHNIIITLTLATTSNLSLLATALLTMFLLFAYRDISEIKNKSLFKALTGICLVKSVIAITLTVSGIFYNYDHSDPLGNKVELIAGIIDSYLLFILMIVVGLSFVMKNPFFYKPARSSIYPMIGGLLILGSLFLIISSFHSLVKFNQSIEKYENMKREIERIKSVSETI